MKQLKMALMYDFDKTLSPKDMQEYGFISSLGVKPEAFWKEVSDFSKKNKMDGILTYLYMMLKKAEEHGQSIRKEDFVQLGKSVELFPNVETWFERINAYALSKGLILEHYIISSGVTEIIEGTSIAHHFKKIYACKYLYNPSGMACWPATAVNYTTKTQYIYRVNKGILDENNHVDLNLFTPEEKRPIPFSRMIYLGDGLTDVPCMKLVKANGGHAIAIYRNKAKSSKDLAKQLVQDQRVDFIANADYGEQSELDTIIKAIIDHTATTIQMELLMGKK